MSLLDEQKEVGKRHGDLKAALAAALCIVVVYLFMTTRSTLWDRDEPRFARAAVEMVESGRYLVPSFNGEVWADKPVFVYWVMSVAIRIFGPSESAFRFFGVVGAGLTCLLTFLIGKRILGAAAGLPAMIILASSLMMLAIGTAATSDAILLPFTVGAMALFARTTERKARLLDVILIGGALGIGMLVKGPMGLMPVPVMIIARLLARRSGFDFRIGFLQLVAAVLLGLLIFSAWAIPANIATHGEFLRVFIGRHVIGRAIRPMEHHGGNFLLYLPYYVPVLILGFFPWSLHLAGGLSALLGARIGSRHARALLMSWVFSVLVIMTLAATKLPHYIIFIWPALAVICAGTLIADRDNRLTDRDKMWLRHGSWFFAIPSAAMALALMIGPWFTDVVDLRCSGMAAGAVLSVMTIVAFRQQQSNRPRASTRTVLAGMLVLGVVFLFGIVPAVERVKIAPPIAAAVKARTDEHVPVAAYKFREPTLNFYIGRHIAFLGSERAVASWANEPGPRVLIIPADRLKEIQARYGVLPLEQIASKKGIDYSKGKILEVAALIRKEQEP